LRVGVFVTPEANERPLSVAALADELGFDVFGVQDHPHQRRFFDTWTLLIAIATSTERITLFSDGANLPLRPPAMHARRIPAAHALARWPPGRRLGALLRHPRGERMIEAAARIDASAREAGRNRATIRRLPNAGWMQAEQSPCGS